MHSPGRAPGVIKVTLRRIGPDLRLSVSDDGIGAVRAAKRERVRGVEIHGEVLEPDEVVIWNPSRFWMQCREN